MMEALVGSDSSRGGGPNREANKVSTVMRRVDLVTSPREPIVVALEATYVGFSVSL